MRRTQRSAAVGVTAALTVALAACGGGQASGDTDQASGGAPSGAQQAPMTSAPMPSTSMPSAPMGAGGEGVTTTEDVFGPACSQLPQGDEPGSLNAMGPQPVASAASTNPLLTTLASAVGEVPGLADTLNSQEAITVFAPADAAFDEARSAMGEEAFNQLLGNPEQLGNILSYHVVPMRYDAAGLVEAGTVTELAGGDVTISGSADAPTITDGQGNTANVLCGNIPTANATVFVLDRVLMPAG